MDTLNFMVHAVDPNQASMITMNSVKSDVDIEFKMPILDES